MGTKIITRNIDDFIEYHLSQKDRKIVFDVETRMLISKGCIRYECEQHPDYYYQVR